MTYQRDKKCACVVASHPKAVAYELSFTGSSGSKEKGKGRGGEGCTCEERRSKREVEDRAKDTLRVSLIFWGCLFICFSNGSPELGTNSIPGVNTFFQQYLILFQ